jgi:hypothetical protein
MFQILRAVVLAILENTLFDASDLTDSDIIPSDYRILYDPKIGLIDLGISYNDESKYLVSWERFSGISGVQPFFIWDMKDIIDSDDNGRYPWPISN